MKHLKTLGLAALAALALTASLGASSASATTLETTGVTTNASETITASLESFAVRWVFTNAAFVNECSASHLHGKTTSPFTAATIGGPVESTTFSSCTRPVTVHKPGSLSITHIASTTNATVRSANAEMTVGSPIGTLTCTTPAASTHLGTLTGSKHGHATLHINAVINCGFLAPSVVFEATFIITSPTGLGVSA